MPPAPRVRDLPGGRHAVLGVLRLVHRRSWNGRRLHDALGRMRGYLRVRRAVAEGDQQLLPPGSGGHAGVLTGSTRVRDLRLRPAASWPMRRRVVRLHGGVVPDAGHMLLGDLGGPAAILRLVPYSVPEHHHAVPSAPPLRLVPVPGHGHQPLVQRPVERPAARQLRPSQHHLERCRHHQPDVPLRLVLRRRIHRQSGSQRWLVRRRLPVVFRPVHRPNMRVVRLHLHAKRLVHGHMRFIRLILAPSHVHAIAGRQRRLGLAVHRMRQPSHSVPSPDVLRDLQLPARHVWRVLIHLRQRCASAAGDVLPQLQRPAVAGFIQLLRPRV